MANEQKPPETQNFEAEDLPLGMFPSPIVDEFFDPYENAADRADYIRLGGSQDYILRYATMKKLRELQYEGGSYGDREQMLKEAMDSIDREEAKRRIAEHFRRS
jgi:hypothetical protein